MKAERYLQSLRVMKFEIEKYEKMRKDIHVDVDYVNNSAMGAVKVQSSLKADKMESEVIKCLEKVWTIDKKLAKLKSNYLKARIDIVDHIDMIPEGQCKRFLMDYYIDCMSMKQLSKMYGYTERTSIYQLRKRAVKKFEKKIQKEKIF